MKKTIITLATVLLGTWASQANQATVINLTPCNYSIDLMGHGSPMGSMVFQGVVNIGPMSTTVYPNPTYTATYWADPSMPPAVQAMQDFTNLRLWNVPTTDWISLTGPTASQSSVNNPACNGGNNFTASWSTNGVGDVVILIF